MAESTKNSNSKFRRSLLLRDLIGLARSRWSNACPSSKEDTPTRRSPPAVYGYCILGLTIIHPSSRRGVDFVSFYPLLVAVVCLLDDLASKQNPTLLV